MREENTSKVVIYGFNKMAQKMKCFFELDGCAEVYAYVADKEYISFTQLEGIPIYPFEDISTQFPPDEYQIAISFGYGNMTRDRQDKYEKCKELGYKIFTYVSKDAKVYTDKIGEGCMIFPGCIVAPYVELDIGCFIDIGVTIAHHSKIGRFNYFSPAVVLCGAINTGNNCFFGAGCVVTNMAAISDFTLVAAGAVITKNTHPNKVYFPSRTTQWRGDSTQLRIP